MSKIICDICGTSYPETESECPICGCSKDISLSFLTEELVDQESEAEVAAVAEVAANSGKAPVFDDIDDEDLYDDEDEDYEDDEDDDEDEDEDDDEDEHKSNAPLVVALVIVILMLLAVGAFILVKYFLPNVIAPEATKPSIVETTEATVETTELKIPCESLVLTSGGEIVLDAEGANWLINVMAMPENTTDALTYISSDENVVTVNEQGKLTAVGEGTAVITIICGEQELKCTVNCTFPQETTVPETTIPEETTAEETTAPEETEPEETKPVEKTGTITATTLNIRETPGTGTIVGLYPKGQKVTILEEKTVNGTTWGRTDRGWISMDHVELDK